MWGVLDRQQDSQAYVLAATKAKAHSSVHTNRPTDRSEQRSRPIIQSYIARNSKLKRQQKCSSTNSKKRRQNTTVKMSIRYSYGLGTEWRR